MEKLISVIVPVYNTGKYLTRCVESILSQDYRNIEVIIVDDGSNDNYTPSVCDELSLTSERVSVIHKENGGAASARNTGIDHSSGAYVGFVDSDDYVERNMYSSLLNQIVDDGSSLALGGMVVHFASKDETICPSFSKSFIDRNELLHNFLIGDFHSTCTNLYDASLFDSVRFPEKEINEDYLVNYKIFSCVNGASVVSYPFYHYDRRGDSVTGSDISLNMLDWFKHTEYVLNDIRGKSGNRSLINEAVFQYLYAFIVVANKALLTLVRKESYEADYLYELSTKKLAENRVAFLKNRHFSGKYFLWGVCLSTFPVFYRKIVLFGLRLKSR